MRPDGDRRGLVDGLGQLVKELLVELFVQGGSRYLPLNPAVLDNTIHGSHGDVQGHADGPGGYLGAV